MNAPVSHPVLFDLRRSAVTIGPLFYTKGPNIMRAVRFLSFGEPVDVLTVEEVPTPPPGLGQVLVRMRVRPINPSDLYMIRGT